MEYSFGAMAWWLRCWFPNPGVPHSKPLGDSKVHSAFHSSEVDKMTTRNLCELSQCHIQQFFLGGASFSMSNAGEKSIVQLRSMGALQTIPSGVQGQSPRKFWLFYILAQKIALVAPKQSFVDF